MSHYEIDGIVQAIAEHERALMAAVLLDFETLPAVKEAFTTTGLRSDRHRLQWQAIEEVADSGGIPDLVTVKAELLRSGHLEDAGGLVALMQLVDGHARSANVSSYALRLRELHGRLDSVRIAERIQSAATNGSTASELATIFAREASQLARAMPAPEIGSAVRLVDVEPESAEFIIPDFILRYGVMWFYGASNALKSYLMLQISTELLAATGPGDLFGNPALPIRGFWRRVVSVSAEETAPRMRARWEMVLGGMKLMPKDVKGTLLHLWPFGERSRFTIDRAEALLDTIGGDIDCVVLDSWTSLLPLTLEGQRVENWDAANTEARALINVLRDVSRRRRVLFVVVDHSGKDESRGARGPSEKRNASDTVVHVERIKERRFRLTVEKQRDGRAPWSFLVRADFEPGRLKIRHEQCDVVALKGAQAKVAAFMQGARRACVTQIVAGTGLARSTCQSALEKLKDLALVESTDEKSPHGSPVWMVPTGAEAAPNNE